MADDQISGSEMRQRLSWGAGIAIGMGVGVALGTALGNMGVGIGLGIAIGLVFAIAIGSIGRRSEKRGLDEDEPEEDAPHDDGSGSGV